MIGGEPATESVRVGPLAAEVRTKYARSRLTPRAARYSIASEGPVQYGLPSRHPRVRDPSADLASGLSSSGATGCQEPQCPCESRALKTILPVPRQCSPTRSKRTGAWA